MFLTALNPDGTGSTPALAVTLPPGLTLYGVAVSLSLATLEFGELTDVLAIPL